PLLDMSIDIKGDMASLMVFLSGFLKGDFFKNAQFNYFAVAAFNRQDELLLHAISSRETADLIGKGDSINWLKSTLFQENTDDYRLGVGKRYIFEIENSLRYIVKNVLSRKFGNKWWDECVPKKISESAKEVYLNKFGEKISIGNILIDYTYLLQLKKVIIHNWKNFEHFFDSKQKFEDTIIKLNVIRREEAHNRLITKEHLNKLKNIYDRLLSKIAPIYPDLYPAILVDNWLLKIKEIMLKSYHPIYKDSDFIDETDLTVKLVKSIVSTSHLITYLENTIEKLNSIVIPIQKRIVHEELVDTFKNYKLLQERKLELINNGETYKIEMILIEISDYETKMSDFAKRFLLSED
ncbi:MAG: Swt1 family HEPN domain-containing protein, partial [Candidatus Paceibacterota bacterium]